MLSLFCSPESLNLSIFSLSSYEGSKELIRQRMEARDHFMPPAMLDSQFATLERPEDAIAIDIELTLDEIVNAILQHF